MAAPVCKLDLYRQLNLPLPNYPATSTKDKTPGRCMRAMGGNEGPICKRDILKQMGLPIPGEDVNMEEAVALMEEDVRNIKAQLDTVQAERRQLEMQKRLLKCSTPFGPADTGTASSSTIDQMKPTPPSQKEIKKPESTQVTKPGSEIVFCNEEEEAKKLEEDYQKLLKDYNAKVEEVSQLRIDVDNAKKRSAAGKKRMEQTEARIEDLETRLKDYEEEGLEVTGSGDKVIELKQQLAMAERMFEKSMDEHESLLKKISCQMKKTDDLRRKYLDAEESAEEQRHRIEILELDRERFGSEITGELSKIKEKFQKKLEEMTLLPDLIKKTNDKLKEVEDLKTTAEKNCVKAAMAIEEANEEKAEIQKQLDEATAKAGGKFLTSSGIVDSEKLMEDTKNENKKLKINTARLEEKAVINGRRLEEATEETKILQEQLETLRQQSARQVAKTKERFNRARHTLQDQICNLEKQLASMRACQKTAFKERDEIRMKMQSQITQLNENFEDAQSRIRCIQSHINYLKSSYTHPSCVSDMALP